ncbi:hypothetical protein Tco_0315894 [Tanacetum coccineum]
MADLKFDDQHNMVACLERTEGNVDFHEIVDFLTASTVHYALTVSPTIYASYIEQFWATAKSKTVNDVKQIHTTVDGKTMTRKRFFRRVTPLFASMLALPVVRGEGSGQPSEPQPPSSTTQPIIEEQIITSVHIPNVADEAVFKEWDDRVVRATTTAASLDIAYDSGNITKTQSTAMSNDPLSQEIGVNTLESDEERIGQQDLIDNVPPTPHDSPLLGGYIPRSDEGRPNINELMAICTNLSNRVLALENSKTAQDLVIQKLKKRVKRLEKALRERTPGMKLFKIGTSRRKGLDKEDASKQGRKSDKIKPMFNVSDFDELDDIIENVEVNTASIDVSAVGPSNVSTVDPSTSTAGDIFEDEMMTIADTLVAIRSTRPITTLVIIHDVEEEPRRSTPAPTTQPSSKDKGKALMVEPEKPPKNPRKAQIQMDEELAIRLHEEEKAELERMQRERAVQEEASNAALIAEFDNVQARIEADALLAARLQEKEREQFSIDEQARFLVETIAERKRFFAAQRAEQIINKPPTKIQLRNKMITYLKNMGRFTYNQLKNKSFKEIQKLYEKEQKWIKDFIPMDSEEGGKKAASKPDEESVKRQNIGETSGSGEEQSTEKEKELLKEELQKLLVVVLVEEVYVEALQVKYTIIDWEIYSEDTRIYDLVKLWDLVKKRFNTTEPTDD